MATSKKEVVNSLNSAECEKTLRDALKDEFGQFQEHFNACKGSRGKSIRFQVDGFDSAQIWHQLQSYSSETIPLVSNALTESTFDPVDLQPEESNDEDSENNLPQLPSANMTKRDMNKFLDDFEKLDEEPIDQLYGSDDTNEDSEDDQLYEDPIAKDLLDKMEEEGEKIVSEKTKFEKENDRISNQIKKLEDKNLKEKPWYLQGEAEAKSRPAGSLLEHFVDFQQVLNAPPVITESITNYIENLIKARIKDKLWDDVERKAKSDKSNSDFQLPGVLNSEKSEMSLTAIYEKEQMNKEFDANNVDNHDELREMLNKVLRKIDALCNLSYGITSMKTPTKVPEKANSTSRKRK